MSDVETITLVDFLLARIAEDEAVLDCGVNSHDGATSADSPTSLSCSCDFRDKREAQSKRRIIARHTATDRHGWCEGCGSEGPCDDPRSETLDECPELRDLAAVYADHPDYRQEWKP